MSVPSVTKITKDGVEFISSVDRVQYTLHELVRAALKDVGKYICNRTRKKILRHTGRLAKNVQYWVKAKQKMPNLQVGFKPSGFYGMYQELGTQKQKKIGALQNSVNGSIADIIQIESQYLSALENEAEALRLIDESEEQGE